MDPQVQGNVCIAKRILELATSPFKPQLGEDLYLYLAVLRAAVSSELICEEKGVQHPVYYVSHSMMSTETRYLSLKKLGLGLLVASHKLKPYFQTHQIIVFTSNLLR